MYMHVLIIHQCRNIFSGVLGSIQNKSGIKCCAIRLPLLFEGYVVQSSISAKTRASETYQDTEAPINHFTFNHHYQ